MPETRFIRPLDTLFLRGNKLFGHAGSHGEANMPPWPSTAAGAIRSRMLADTGIDFKAFAQGEAVCPAELAKAIGTPEKPGTFRVQWFSVAVRQGSSAFPVVPLPADLSAPEEMDKIVYLQPNKVPTGFKASAQTTLIAILRQARQAKPQGGLWLNNSGLAAYINGKALSKSSHTERTGDLWKPDFRIGIALDHEKRTAKEENLFTVEGVSFSASDKTLASKAPNRDIGFLVTITGADGLVPKTGLVRFGGDGRGAELEPYELKLPEPDWERIESEKRFRLVLTTPGIFERGWLPPGILEDGVTWRGPEGIKAKLVCATVPRAQVVSGWDLARWSSQNPGPKPALRTAPTGSVYWFEAADGDGKKLVNALRMLLNEGFWCISEYPNLSRKAEGFNNLLVANWAAE